ncbi:hypothetical protein FSP39_010403 [Pinctada imbricata]|uniref:Uncharacterized protein n=1 Tax=Pinctada imbricata TaxID=66713 RepID=A0AA88Y8F1_PINIB|nr:hypothetical protein FSP39_010403 [Pinctada imbricata]
MFYEPRNKGLSSVQYLVVGLVRDEAMWAEPFNLRNFPLLQRAIKDNNATGVSGSGAENKKRKTAKEIKAIADFSEKKQVTAITRIYMFYEPRNKGLSSVQYLVVGLVRDEAMWAEPFNLRNFPLLQRAIKDNNATGVSGSGHEAKFIVRIKYEDCETLPGKFFFEVIGTVRKAKSVIEGFYEIPNDSHLSRIPRSCLYRKPKPNKNEDKGSNDADKGKDKVYNKVEDKVDTFKDRYNAKVTNLGKVVSKIKTRNRDKVEVEKAKPETESSNNTLLVVAIVILCVVIVVVAGFFIMKARKKQEEGEESRPILNKTDENAEDISISDDEKKAKKKRKKKKRRDGEQKSKERKENEEPEEEKIQEEERKDEESKNNSNVYYQYKRPIRHRQSYVVPPDYVRSRDVLHKYTKTPSYMRYSYPQQTYRGPQNLVPATSLTQYAGTSSYDHCMAQQSVRHNYIPVNDYRSYDDIFRPSMYVDHEVDLTQSRPVPQPTYVTPRHRVSHTRPIMSDHQYPKNFTNGVKGGHPSQHEGRTAGDTVYGQSSQQRDLIQLHTDGQKSNERKNVAASTAELAVPKNTPEINEHNDNEQKPCVSEQVMDSELHGDTSLPENVDPNLLSTLVKRRLSFAPSSASTNIQDLG